jgi:hypothetical protein
MLAEVRLTPRGICSLSSHHSLKVLPSRNIVTSTSHNTTQHARHVHVLCPLPSTTIRPLVCLLVHSLARPHCCLPVYHLFSSVLMWFSFVQSPSCSFARPLAGFFFCLTARSFDCISASIHPLVCLLIHTFDCLPIFPPVHLSIPACLLPSYCLVVVLAHLFCCSGGSCALWKCRRGGYECQGSHRLLGDFITVFPLLERVHGRQWERGRQMTEYFGSLLFVLFFVSLGVHRGNTR